MWDEKDSLKEMLKRLESFKQEIMKEINRLGKNDEAIRRTTVYPMAKVKPLIINEYPVFQFSYEGILPHYKENDHDYLSMIRHYYYRATFDSYDFSKFQLPVMEKAVVIFVHYFNNNIIRDLDNRNTKYIQDAIKQTRIIRDDNWKNVWNMNIAFLDEEKCHLQVYVVPSSNIGNFIDYLISHHEDLKKDTDYPINRVEFERQFIKFQKKEKEKCSNITELDSLEKGHKDSSVFY